MHFKGSDSIRILAAVLSFSTCSQASFKIPHGLNPPKVDYTAHAHLITRSSADAADTAGDSANATLAFSGDRSKNPPACRYIPGDAAYPSETTWGRLNKTVGGRLVRGEPLAAHICYGVTANAAACAELQQKWDYVDPFLPDPVNVMSPYWLNNSCNPLPGSPDSCKMGNLAPYAIRVSGAGDVVAGVKFAKENNIRLTIKNTGHDYLGRSVGEGSLALWMHKLKDIKVLDYKSRGYTGKAVKFSAGVQVLEAYKAAKDAGLRIVGGACPSVGVSGGWLPGGGHGPLSSAYGLGADQTLEFEVVTAKGEVLVASQTQNSDLYWALSGGGSGNYGVVLSATVKAYRDGPVAGFSLVFLNTNPDAYWGAIKAWIARLVDIDIKYPRLNSAATFTDQFFSLDFVTLPDGTAAELNTALAPFLSDLQALNVTPINTDSHVSNNYFDHYQHFTTEDSINGTNLTIGNRLIPRSLAQPGTLPTLVSTIRGIANQTPGAVFVIINNNVTHANVGNKPGSNSVLPAWRDSLFLLNFGSFISYNAPWSEKQAHQALINSWIDRFRALTPGGGTYINEATYNYPTWKQEYFGANYDRLAAIKAKYDPEYLFFNNAAVGSDTVWKTAGADGSGRLCRRAGRSSS
ncbi:FAD-binding domain-protein [Cladorrhinum sp. PSN332]|nr:FAD-binding domain-protein [Cladorrhinum sp. PSN332]